MLTPFWLKTTWEILDVNQRILLKRGLRK